MKKYFFIFTLLFIIRILSISFLFADNLVNMEKCEKAYIKSRINLFYIEEVVPKCRVMIQNGYEVDTGNWLGVEEVIILRDAMIELYYGRQYIIWIEYEKRIY